MKTEYFDYNLPKELIAQSPADKRHESRLMVINRDSGSIEHKHFHDLPDYLKAEDLLVINNTKVIRARLIGSREVLLINKLRYKTWESMVKPQKGLKIGDKIYFNNNLIQAKVCSKTEEGTYILEFSNDDNILNIGYMPLPPYIKRDYKKPHSIHRMDSTRYQTVYAEKEGAIAAPTAGMHFTHELLAKIKCPIAPITLHVGWGTFKPIRTKYIKDHRMLPEWFSIPQETAYAIKKAKRIVAVGTTTVRALETGTKSGYTNLFIHPGYKFKTVDALITNFHLPKSTLLMLVCAFAGRNLIINAYNEAVKHKYRFYSYGDAMLIL